MVRHLRIAYSSSVSEANYVNPHSVSSDVDDIYAGMDDSKSMDGSMIALFVVVAFVCTFIVIVICFCFQKRQSDTIEAVDTRDLLTRQDLNSVVLSEGQVEWQCIVCAHLNHPDASKCLLCGAAADTSTFSASKLGSFDLTDSMLISRHNATMSMFSSTSSFHNSTLLKSSSSVVSAQTELDDAMTNMRQRALRYRRLNEIQLNQRQRGASKRRMWQRVPIANGTYVWVRTSQHVGRKMDPLVKKLNDGRSQLLKSLSVDQLDESLADQLHRKNLKSIGGFFSEVNSTGDVQMKKMESFTLPLDTSDHILQDSTIDFEGLLAMTFNEKRKWFINRVADLSVHYMDGMTKMKIRRDHVLEDSVKLLGGYIPQECMTEHLHITFDGEPGLDAGGILREWFGIVCKELFSADTGLFISTHAESQSYWINPASDSVEDYLTYFTFAGRLFGKAILDGLVFEVRFALPLLKHILGVPISFSDLEFLDDELYRNCVWVRDNDNVDQLCLTFTTTAVDGSEVELIPGGADIEVTDGNKKEYLAAMLRYKLLGGIDKQLGAMLTGMYEVIPKRLLGIFDYQELDFFMCGLPSIDVMDWKSNSRVIHHAHEVHKEQREKEKKVVDWFWEVVENFSEEQLGRLLQFATGATRVPVEGFRALMSASGYIHIFTLQIVPRGTPPAGLCPHAHTCFNRVDLPIYDDKDELETYLTLVLQMEITGFGLE